MKGMRFSLDMIFIEGMKVVEIRANIPAPVEGHDGREISVASTVLADMVLEVNAGWASTKGIQIGDKVSVDLN